MRSFFSAWTSRAFGLGLVFSTCPLLAAEWRVAPADPNCSDQDRTAAFCTLGAAIRLSESTPGPDVLRLAKEARITLEGSDHEAEGPNALPAIGGQLVIEGEGSRIERDSSPGSPPLRLFRVLRGGELTLRQLTLANGATPRYFDGAAVWNLGRLTVEGCTFENNASGDDGGAIRNDGELVVTGSTFRRNTASWRGGVGGAIQSVEQSGVARQRIASSVFVENSADAVGGALWLQGKSEVLDSTFSGNRSGNRGGAIQNYGELDLQRSTLVGNHTEVTAGGLHNFGTTRIANSIVTDNLAMISADCQGTLISLGYNRVGRLHDCALSGNAPGDLIGVSSGSPDVWWGLTQADLLAKLRALGAEIKSETIDTGGTRYLVTLGSLWTGGNDGLRLLLPLPGVYKLRVSGDITNEGLKTLGQLLALEGLDLHLPAVTDQGVAHLRPLVGLRRLNLTYTQVSDAGLEHLLDMKQLVWLGLAYTRVSTQGAESLKARMPNVIIEGAFR